MLTEDQKAFYAENGYVLLDNVFTDGEFNEISSEYDGVFERAQGSRIEGTWSGEWQKDGMPKQKRDYTVHSIHNLQFHSATFMRMLMHEKMLAACRDVMNTDNILLHHTKGHVKPPGRGSPYPMHQDYHYFPFRHDSMVAVFLHLDDSDVENGCLAVYPGSHKLGPQKDCSSDPKYHHLDQTEFPLSKAAPLEAKRGTVAIFSYLLIHGSYPNLSERTRRMLLIQLSAAEDEPLELIHISPGHGLCLCGKNTGAEADLRLRFKIGVD